MPASKPRPFPASAEDLLSGKLVQLGNLLLRSASRRYRRRFGLRNEEWRILALLGSEESVPLTDLAGRAGLRKSQMSRGAASLLLKGLLSRIVSVVDAREARLHLTPRGRRIHDAIVASAIQRSSHLASGLGKRELGPLLKTLDLLIERARELDESA
jgi:DNA-binding MarR family transcriptional regulator